MIRFVLNNQTIETDLPKGVTVLDFVRYRKNLKGTKIGCREGDCGACTILVGELQNDSVRYRTQTSCLMPLANARGKHIVTVEGINRADGELTEVQQALVDESGTQCGFCTVGFVMSLTNFCVDASPKTNESAISAIDGNICRCTGYKSIERACAALSRQVAASRGQNEFLSTAIEKGIVPGYFADIAHRLKDLTTAGVSVREISAQTEAAHDTEDLSRAENPKSEIRNPKFISGGTDLYVQRPEEMTRGAAENLFDDAALKFVRYNGEFVEIGASSVVTDLLESEIFQNIFPNLYRHLKLVSSTPIRNMATVAGNLVNASPIGDLTVWFLALDASIVFNTNREIPLKDFYLGYKTLAKTDDEFVTKIRFRRNFAHFNFEKVCKRTYLDIATVNTAISLKSEPPAATGGLTRIVEAHVSMGGIAPIPLHLQKTSEFLRGKEISDETISRANEILQTEISPISDVRGSAEYKRLLARQLFTAHFVELFGF